MYGMSIHPRKHAGRAASFLLQLLTAAISAER